MAMGVPHSSDSCSATSRALHSCCAHTLRKPCRRHAASQLVSVPAPWARLISGRHLMCCHFCTAALFTGVSFCSFLPQRAWVPSLGEGQPWL